jgi:voltage-gated potassium channel
MILDKIKHKIYTNLEPDLKDSNLSIVGKIICFFIFLSFVNSILETENSFYLKYQLYFSSMEKVFFWVFFIEYIVRLWICDLNEIYEKYKYKRLKYFFSFYALLDLLTLLIIIIPYINTSPAFLRMFRLIKILRIIKFGRFSNAISRLKYALSSRAPDLLLTLSVAFIVMVMAASLLYLIESDVNPQAFGSIPRAMWWAVVTLTTVGYGDVYPITLLGRVVGAFISIIGLGLIAMPAGILAAAFSDAMRIERRKQKAKKTNKK